MFRKAQIARSAELSRGVYPGSETCWCDSGGWRVSGGIQKATEHERDANAVQNVLHCDVSSVNFDPTATKELLSDVESLALLMADEKDLGMGAEPSPVMMTAFVELAEIARLVLLIALSAPANIRAAAVAVIVFFTS